MGLYLCVFDRDDEELEGVEVGSYADFNYFRDTVIAVVEKGQAGSVCPVIINHADSDGLWTPTEAAALLGELKTIETVLSANPPADFNSPWKAEVARTFGITPRNLLESFFDIDGEPLTERLKQLAEVAIARQLPILFQ